MSENKCKACENSGLPIVFLFHGAVAKDAELAPQNAKALATDLASVDRAKLPKLTHARYVLRSLRPGAYLHVYHETPPEVLKQKAKVHNEALKKASRPTRPPPIGRCSACCRVGHWCHRSTLISPRPSPLLAS